MSSRPTHDARPFVGTLQTEPGRARTESHAGIKMAMLELSWRDLEPSRGHFSSGYVRSACAQLADFRRAGMQVTLGLGLHFTPQWVLDMKGSRFVDQDGNVSAEADFVFNRRVRALATQYIDKLDELIGFQNFWAVRITAGGEDEVIYPSNGVYWAFSAAAQNRAPRPDGLAANPLPGWRPGHEDTSPSSAARTKWAEWYVGALANDADWQMDELRGLGFVGYLQVLTPGQGVRPNQIPGQVAAGLPIGTLGRGAVWSWLYGDLHHHRNVTAYVSSLADGSGNDDDCKVTDRSIAPDSQYVDLWSAARWISYLAARNGLSVAGEIPGYPSSLSAQEHYADSGSSGLTAKAYSQAKSCGFLGLYWAHDAQIAQGKVSLRVVAGHTGPSAKVPAAAPKLK